MWSKMAAKNDYVDLSYDEPVKITPKSFVSWNLYLFFDLIVITNESSELDMNFCM
jgi:hypothetical protein